MKLRGLVLFFLASLLPVAVGFRVDVRNITERFRLQWRRQNVKAADATHATQGDPPTSAEVFTETLQAPVDDKAAKEPDLNSFATVLQAYLNSETDGRFHPGHDGGWMFGMSAYLLATFVISALFLGVYGLFKAKDSGKEVSGVDITVLREIIWVAVPNILGGVLSLVNEITNTVFLGHAGTQVELAAVGLGNMMQNCAALSVTFGICSALDTLVSQAYQSGQHQLCCYYLQRCRVILTLQLLWVAPVLWYSEHILVLMRQDPEIAKAASAYNRAALFGLFAMFYTTASVSFMRNRGDALVPVLIGGLVSVMHIGWCAVFVLFLGWGNAGAGWANTTSWCVGAVLQTVYLVMSAQSQGLSVRSVVGIEGPGLFELGSYLSTALPATLLTCSEWWFWELCALMVGYMGKVALGAHVVAGNFVAITFSPVLGLNAAAATLVVRALASSLPRRAEQYAVCCVGLDVVMWACMGFGIIAFGPAVAATYTNDPEVQAVTQRLFAIFAFAGFCDSAQSIMGGILRGLGMQQTAATIYIAAYYGVMLPLSACLGFTFNLGVYGVWYSFVLGTALAAVAFTVLLAQANFHEQAILASEQSQQEAQMLKALRGKSICKRRMRGSQSNSNNSTLSEKKRALSKNKEKLPAKDAAQQSNPTQPQILLHSMD